MQEAPARVTNISTNRIMPNPHNPRRLFDEGPMDILRRSIQELGILVPLDVYPDKTTSDSGQPEKYILLDGERRWRCANDLGLTKVPCIVVATPTPERNILVMFHIHNLREGWQLMPTALKLQNLMKMLKTTNERVLAELTKLNVSQVRRCKILLTYPKKYQQMMLAPLSERYKADFFVDLHRIRGPALEERFPPWIKRGDSKCIDIMISKYDNEVIRAVTDFRKLIATYRACVVNHKKREFMSKFDRFLDVPDMGIDDIQIEGATFAVEAKELSRSTKRLLTQLSDLDLENLSSDEDLIGDLRRLANMIRNKLENALLLRPRDQ